MSLATLCQMITIEGIRKLAMTGPMIINNIVLSTIGALSEWFKV